MDDKTTSSGSQDMDELTAVRRLLAPPPPPRPQVSARSWQRLASLIDDSSALPGPWTPGADQPPARRLAPEPPPAVRWPGAWSRRARWAAALTGVVAAGLAGALTVMLVPGGARPGGSQPRLVTSERPFGTLTGQPAGAYLTALATRVAAARPATARYWCLSGTSAQIDPIGPGGQELTPAGQGVTPSPVSDYRYSIFARQLAVTCENSTGTSNLPGYAQDLGAQPASAADRAAWQRTGSPAWHAWYGNGQLIPARPGPRQLLYKHGQGGQGGRCGPLCESVAALPTSPAKLRELLGNRFSSAWILLEQPLPQAVRAADYQVLASIPGVHAKTGVTDPSGRPGTALWSGPRSDPGFVVIVDPVTGMLLADEFLATAPHGVYAPGTLLQYVLWSGGWTSQLPRP